MIKINYKQSFLLSLVLIALGVTFSASAKGETSSLGTVLIALGGFFLIVSMAKKQKDEENKNKRK